MRRLLSHPARRTRITVLHHRTAHAQPSNSMLVFGKNVHATKLGNSCERRYRFPLMGPFLHVRMRLSVEGDGSCHNLSSLPCCFWVCPDSRLWSRISSPDASSLLNELQGSCAWAKITTHPCSRSSLRQASSWPVCRGPGLAVLRARYDSMFSLITPCSDLL